MLRTRLILLDHFLKWENILTKIINNWADLIVEQAKSKIFRFEVNYSRQQHLDKHK